MSDWLRVNPVFSHPSYGENTGFFKGTFALADVARALYTYWSGGFHNKLDRDGKRLYALVEPLHAVDLATHYTVDRGGIMWAGRHEYAFELDGLRLRMPAVQLELQYEKLVGREPERIRGHDFYGVSGRWWQLALVAHQRDALLSKMGVVLPEARAIADAENDRFNREIATLPHVAVEQRPVRRPPGRT